MSRRKKRKLVAIGSLALALLTALFSCLRDTDPRAGDDRPTVLEGYRFPVQALAFGPDGTTLTSAACFLGDARGEMEVTVWALGTGNPPVTRTAASGEILYMACAPGGQTLAFSLRDRTVWLWDVTSLPTPRRLCERDSMVTTLAFSGSGGRLATADQVGRVMLWDWAAGQSRACNRQRDSPGLALAFAPDEASLAVGGSERLVRVWDMTTEEERCVLPGHARSVIALAFSDSRILVSGDDDGFVKLWDLTAGREWDVLPQYKEEITALAVSPDGRMLAVASGSNVELWDVTEATLLARRSEHLGKVKCLAFAPDSKLLASGSYDKTVRCGTWRRTGPRRREIPGRPPVGCKAAVLSDLTADRDVEDDTQVAAADLPHDLAIAQAAEAVGQVQPRHGAQPKVMATSTNSVPHGEGWSLRCFNRGASPV
jgi:WD40 repeat protein